MDADYSLKALMRFIKYSGEKGFITANASRNWRSAAEQILVDLAPGEEADVQKIDVESAVIRWNNRSANKPSPGTLKDYSSRIKAAIKEFLAYTADPLNYKPKAAVRERGKAGEKSASKNTNVDQNIGGKRETKAKVNVNSSQGDEPSEHESEVHASVGRLMKYNFLLRHDLEIPIVIPPDLTIEDVRRIEGFLKALVLPSNSSSQSTE